MVEETNNDSNKTADDKVEKDIEPFSSSVQYTLIDEALMAFENENYIVLFSTIVTLSHVFNGNDVIKSRLERLTSGVEIQDINGNGVKIPVYSLMRVAFSALNRQDRYLKTFRDIDRNIVHIYISDLIEAYYYIGRLLHVALFEMLTDNYIELPVEMYSNRYAGNE